MVDPRHAVNLTIYHEVQPRFVAVGLVNQDSGDLHGDAYFVLRGLILPVECASSSPFARFDCDNPEQNATSNVIAQHLVTVDSRFGPYGSCNVAAHDQYECHCTDAQRKPVPCGSAVGRVGVIERESEHKPLPSWEAWQWWRLNLAYKTGGHWFSTVSAGQCGHERGPCGTNCTWSLQRTPRIIVAGCLEQRVAQALRAFNPPCYASCADPTNSTAPCVVDCYMQALLGVGGSSRKIDPDKEGMPLHLVTDAWERAFASNDPELGGCPDAPRAPLPSAWPLSWGGRLSSQHSTQ